MEEMQISELNKKKLDLIDWINQLSDKNTIELLDNLKSASSKDDWWDELSDNEQKKSDWKNADVLFYINPFSKGTVFSKKDIDQFLKQIKLEHNDSYYKPCDNVKMLERLLRNLSNSFDKIAYPQKAKEINNLLNKLLKYNK